MWLRILVGIILTIVTLPILTIVLMSFTSVSYFQFPPPGFSFKWYVELFETNEWLVSAGESLKVASLTTVLATILGTLAANAVLRIQFWGKSIFLAIMVSPIIIPVVIIGVALYNFFAPLKLTGTISGLVLSHTILALPVVFVIVLASLKGVDQNLEKAAMGLGSTPVEAFIKVTVPLIKPALFSGALFAFILSFDELVVSFFLAGPETKTLPVKMWEELRTQIKPTIAAISTILISIITIVYFLQDFLKSKTKV